MSQNYKFVIWTDASSIESNGVEETTTGFVIKDGYFPPLINSDVHEGIGNSKGELKASIESLRTLIEYCDCFDIDTKNAVVELKTDFPELKRAIEEKLKSNDPKKLKLIRRIKKLKSEFGYVACDEIHRRSNIAHNVCYFRRRDWENGTVKNFHEIYDNPDLCIVKSKSCQD